MLFWEVIATIFAGLGAVGLVLTIRLITRIKLPRWILPTVAALGMFSFQIYSEYTWFDHQNNRLPEGADVVRSVEETSFWRPWSYFAPQTMRFIAADFGNAQPNDVNPDLIRLDLYVFQRRQPAQQMTQVIHCTEQARADYTETLQLPAPGQALPGGWYPLADNDPILKVCP